MARWASLIDRRRADHHVILIDAGDFCNPVSGPHADFEDDFFFEALRLMGYDAAAIGPAEIRFGRARLFERAAAARLDLLSANIRDRRENRLLGKAWKIVHVGGGRTLFGRAGGVRVGLFAVTLPHLVYQIDPVVRDYYEVYDPRIAALEAVTALRAKECDLIVGISHQGWTNSVALAEQVPGIDIVVNGRSARGSARGERHADVLVVDTGMKQVSLAEIRAQWRSGSPILKVVEAGAEARAMPERADLKALNERYARQRRARGLETLEE